MVTICTARLKFKNSTFCPHCVFMCFVWIWEQTAIISLYNINWSVCITETECVYCAVRTGSLYIIQVILSTCFSAMSFEGDLLRTARHSASVPLQAHPWPVRTNVDGQSIYSDTMININTWRLTVCLKVISCSVRLKLDKALPALQGSAVWRRLVWYVAIDGSAKPDTSTFRADVPLYY